MMRAIYLALAVWGAVHPMYWFVTYMRETGTGLGGLIDAWYVNALDHRLDMGSHDCRHRADGVDPCGNGGAAGVAEPCRHSGNLLHRVSCGLPLYLYLRSRPSA